jgi:seryl-tRNA synthetase
MSEQQEDLANVVNELLEINKQISDARDDLKVLTNVEKKLKEKLKSSMMTKDIDTINLKKGKIKLKKSVKKATFNKKSVTEGLTKFFNGDPNQVDGALNAIKEVLPEKENVTLSMTGIKDKKE